MLCHPYPSTIFLFGSYHRIASHVSVQVRRPGSCETGGPNRFVFPPDPHLCNAHPLGFPINRRDFKLERRLHPLLYTCS